MLDLHVLTHQGTRKDWLDHGLRSLEGQQFNVHIHFNRHKTIAEGRVEAMRLGTSPYVTYMDDDDWLLESAYERIAPHLESNLPFYATGELEFDQKTQRLKRGRAGHHLLIVRRDVMEAALDTYVERFADWAEYGSFRKIAGTPKLIHHPCYVWRRHDTQASSLQRFRTA